MMMMGMMMMTSVDFRYEIHDNRRARISIWPLLQHNRSLVIVVGRVSRVEAGLTGWLAGSSPIGFLTVQGKGDCLL